MELSQDALYVIESYKTHFLGKKKIVLYGIGINTKAILTEIHDPNIIGLMDPLSEGSVVLGKPVLSATEASQQAGLIVIVARPTVVPIIFDRIRDLEVTHHIPIYNIEGKRLIEEEETPFSSDLPYWNCNSEVLKQKIATADVISFDIFDTLLARDVLRPVDLFFFLERKLQKEGIPCTSFAAQRSSAETQLNQTCVPKLEQIYEQLGAYYAWPKEIVDKACALEFELEQKACHARRHMRDIYHYALGLKKTVILVSDMYLDKEKMQILLARAGYTNYHRLYVSCEQQATKESGALFDVVRKDYCGTILHIGDNAAVDDIMARRHGFTTYPILSAYDMLLHSSMGKIVAKAQTPDSMLTLGIVVRKMFDDPFALGPTKGVVCADDLFLLGFVFIGPVISCYVRWLCKEVWDRNYDMILFSARDGYVIEKLYHRRWIQTKEHLPKGVYFKTSRRAVTVAAIENEADMAEILLKPYNTLKGQLLSTRFGIDPLATDLQSPDSAVSTQNAEEVEQYIEGYQESILENAEEERIHYLAYMKKIGLTSAKRVLLYDFCSRGTIQHYLAKLLGPHIQIDGIYFATMEWSNIAYNKNSVAFSLFGDVHQYHSGFATTQNYMFLEAALLDHCTTCLCCKADGNFAYEKDENDLRDIDKLAEIQRGICDFDYCVSKWEELLDTVDENFRNFADSILGAFFSQNCKQSTLVREAISVDNAYDFEQPYKILV